MITLSDAREHVQNNLDEGVSCPCCDQYARRYRRKFNSTMARSLLWLVNQWMQNGGGWVDVPKTAPRWLVRSNQLPTVRWWDLIKRAPNNDPSIKHSGLWAPTQAGIDFALLRAFIPCYATTYKGAVLWLDGELIGVSDALGRHFDYSEIMTFSGVIPQSTHTQIPILF